MDWQMQTGKKHDLACAKQPFTMDEPRIGTKDSERQDKNVC